MPGVHDIRIADDWECEGPPESRYRALERGAASAVPDGYDEDRGDGWPLAGLLERIARAERRQTAADGARWTPTGFSDAAAAIYQPSGAMSATGTSRFAKSPLYRPVTAGGVQHTLVGCWEIGCACSIPSCPSSPRL